MASLADGLESESDRDSFETAADILHQLDRNGNSAAKEFSKHVSATRVVLDHIAFTRQQSATNGTHGLMPTVCQPEASHLWDRDQPSTVAAIDASLVPMPEISLQDFLSQPNFDLDLLEPCFGDEMETFTWPEPDENALSSR